ncbi:MAG: rRNA maturation RNase YbeY [Bacteroidetes bacterium]|nr:MAG: rRNA maturation RNase YbeY [Bacteroidota bacterium]
MISFNYETPFKLNNEIEISKWISSVISSEKLKEGDINYVFCDDDYLLKLNIKFLSHDNLTDIISFDDSIGKILQGDVFISIERIKENAENFNVSFQDELSRVMVHGVLHYCGYNDKTEADIKIMRDKENFYINQLS